MHSPGCYNAFMNKQSVSETDTIRPVARNVIKSGKDCMHIAMAASHSYIDPEVGTDGKVPGSINPIARKTINQALETVPFTVD